MSSAVPSEIPGIGSSAMKLRVSPGFDPLKAQVGPDEYFVLSRIDGTQTLRDVLLATGLPVDRGIAIITKLRSIGALLLPGETSAPMPASVPPKGPGPNRRTGTTPVSPVTPPHGMLAISRTATPATPMPTTKLPARAATPPLGVAAYPAVSRTTTPATPLPMTRAPARPAPVEPAPGAREDGAAPRRTGDGPALLPDPTEVERAALAESCDLAEADRLRILALARLVDARDPWALLGVPSGSEPRVLKRAYFKLSKEVHPDRYYGRQLGSFADRLSLVFEAVSRAYAKLTTPDKGRPSGAQQVVTEQPQTPQEYAAELFDRACGLEVGGDALGAMKLFAAAVRIDPHTRYLRRAASCALAAEQPKTALEYAKKAQVQSPNDPSAARLLAAAFKAAGRLVDAEEVLIMAMAIKSENDVLTAELRNDLAEVRRLLAG